MTESVKKGVLLLVVMNEKLKTILTELRRYLAELYGERLVYVVLFGSQARGDAVEGSDIDLLIVLNGHVYPGLEIDRTGNFVAAMSLEHDVLISTVFVSENDFVFSRMPLMKNVRQEGIRV